MIISLLFNSSQRLIIIIIITYIIENFYSPVSNTRFERAWKYIKIIMNKIWVDSPGDGKGTTEEKQFWKGVLWAWKCWNGILVREDDEFLASGISGSEFPSHGPISEKALLPIYSGILNGKNEWIRFILEPVRVLKRGTGDFPPGNFPPGDFPPGDLPPVISPRWFPPGYFPPGDFPPVG